MVFYLLADVKRHWLMSAEVSSGGGGGGGGSKFVNSKCNRYLSR